MFNSKIHKWFKDKGYRVGIGGIDLIERAERELGQRKSDEKIDPVFFEEYLSSFRGCDDYEGIHTSALIVAAIPRPAHIISFELDTRIIEMILPPTYKDYRGLFETTRLELENQVFAGKIQVKTLSAPLKAIANLLGIVSYGRNNLTYIPEFGSYLQLVGFHVNTPLLQTKSIDEQGSHMMKECTACRACSMACPMGVISEDRFLIHAEKCYTLYSESVHPLPAGIYPPSPSCIIGCMKCQEVCPANKGRLKHENTDVSFSPEETQAILDSGPMNPDLLRTAEIKFASLGLSESADIFFRNFRNIMNIQKTSRNKGVIHAK